MEVTLKNRTIRNGVDVLERLAKKGADEIPHYKARYGIGRTLAKLKQARQALQEEHLSILNEHVAKDEDGNIIPKTRTERKEVDGKMVEEEVEIDGTWTFATDEEEEACTQAIQDLYDDEMDGEVHLVRLDYFDGAGLTGEEFEAISFMIAEE